MRRTYHLTAPAPAAKPTTVLVFGLGPIGLAAARLVLRKPGLKLIAAVDADPKKAGQDLGELLAAATSRNIKIHRDIDGALAAGRPDVVLHATGSSLEKIREQLETLVSRKLPVISSSEELFYPYLSGSRICEDLDRVAREKGVTIMGTGVNPGFVMDVLPVLVSSISPETERIGVERVVDVSTRREPLQRKVGLGLSPEEFEAGARAGTVGHVGLPQSATFMASCLGFAIDRIEESLDPILATEEITTTYFKVAPGRVQGLRQICRGLKAGDPLVVLDLTMRAYAEMPSDRITLEGDPSLCLEIKGGTPGDHATPAAMVHAIPRILGARPGLLTMAEIALPTGSEGRPLRLTAEGFAVA